MAENSPGPMAGQTALVTGGTGGIGRATAAGLAALGARVGITGRDKARTQAAAAQIAHQAGNPAVGAFAADMSSQAEVRRLAAAVLDAYPRLDVLINNVGGFWATRHVTADGLERTFAVNHLAAFLLTGLLLDRLKASAPARIVTVSSGAHATGTLNFDDLNISRHALSSSAGRSLWQRLRDIVTMHCCSRPRRRLPIFRLAVSQLSSPHPWIEPDGGITTPLAGQPGESSTILAASEAHGPAAGRPERGTGPGRSGGIVPTLLGQPLTGREIRVLRLLRGSLTLREIGAELGLSPNTIKTRTQAIYRKLGVSTRQAAITRGQVVKVMAFRRAMRAGPLRDPLTEREIRVLRLLRGSLTLRGIGAELGLSPNTIKTRTQAIYRKLGVSTRQAAIIRAQHMGILGTAADSRTG